MKTCIKCLKEKEIEFFQKNKNECKECKSLYIKNYYLKNKNKILNKEKTKYKLNASLKIKKQKEYVNNNKEKIKQYSKNYRIENKEILKEKRKRYNNINKLNISNNRKKRYKERIKTDLNFKLKRIHRSLLHRILKNKNNKTSELLGYSHVELKLHLENKFKDGMSWDNYGVWEIDHIIPISAFDLFNTPPNIINALDNLQPLWKIENINKSNIWK